LIVNPEAKVRARIVAREVIVMGSITGDVEAVDRLEIRKNARLTGDAKTAKIVIEDGGYFEGIVDVVGEDDGATHDNPQADDPTEPAELDPLPRLSEPAA
jgi:cytoskeletal protein CcmA (bactofilin family)